MIPRPKSSSPAVMGLCYVLISFLIAIPGAFDPVGMAPARYLPATRLFLGRVAQIMSFAWGKPASGSHGFFMRTTKAFHDDLRSHCTCKAKVLQNPKDFNDFAGRRGSFLESFSLHFCFQLRLEIVQDSKEGSMSAYKNIVFPI